MKFIIKNREINNFLKPYIIAEACINHEGNFEAAEKMIISAKESGVDCVKFQIHVLENEMLRFQIIQLSFVFIIYSLFSISTSINFFKYFTAFPSSILLI